VDTKSGELIIDEPRRRRRHSQSFRDEAIAACQHSGVSIASVALARGLNANLLRRWVIEAEGRTRPAAQLPVMPSFVPVGCCRFRGHQLKLIGPAFQNLQG